MSFQVTVSGKDRETFEKNFKEMQQMLFGNKPATVVEQMYPLDNNIPEDNDDVMEPVESPFKSTTTPPVPTGELDAKGYPWDERIHASSQKKIGDGTWRTKRGVEDSMIAQIKAEYRQRNPITAPTAAPTPVYPAPVSVVHVAPAAPVVQAPIVQAPVVQAAPPLPIAPAMPNGHTLQSFIQGFHPLIATLISEGKIDQGYINTLKEHFKVTEIYLLSDEQKAALFEGFVSFGFIQKVG